MFSSEAATLSTLHNWIELSAGMLSTPPSSPSHFIHSSPFKMAEDTFRYQSLSLPI